METRRTAIKKIRTAVPGIGMGKGLLAADSPGEPETEDYRLKGNINHSVCLWTYNFLPLDELCGIVKKIGFSAIYLAGPKDWTDLKKHGIDSYSPKMQRK